MSEINSILLIDDENLFHLVFEDACSILDISLNLQSVSTAEEAESMFKKYYEGESGKPECVFVDLNIIGSAFDGIELVRRINHVYGNGVVIGIISSSSDEIEMERAKQAGAQFWIIKSHLIEPRLESFKADLQGYKERTLPFKVYAQ
jgi:CheY-like chemotaxis protein